MLTEPPVTVADRSRDRADAPDHATAFSAFDRDIPWFLVLGYVPWVGLLPCVAPQMAAMPIVCGFLLYAIGDHLSGWRRALLGFVPTLALPLVYASTSWPLYVALYSDIPKVVEYGAGALMLAFAAAVTALTTAAAQRWRAGELALATGGPGVPRAIT